MQVEGTINVFEKLSPKQYIESLRETRSVAIGSPRLLRNLVDKLRKSRKLHCDMHEKIGTVWDFWRNYLVEDSFRSIDYV